MSRSVPRFAHGSRVPGWDEAADLQKDPAGVPELATTEISDHLRADIEAHMASYPDRRSAALPALAAAQREHGWCSPQAIAQVAAVMRLTPGYLVAVASFYDMLETSPVGRHSIYVCTNISCSLCGADALLAAIERAAGEDPEFNVRSFECLGACDMAPMASVDGVYVGPLGVEDVERMFDEVRGGRPVLADKQVRVLPCADPGAAAPGAGDRGEGASESAGSRSAPHRAEAGAANPAVAPDRGAFGGRMEGDEPGPPAAIEQSPQDAGDEGDGDGEDAS